MPNFAGTWTVTTQGQARGQSTWPATPGAPTIGTATAGQASASVTFTAPIDPGFPATITSYTVTSSPGGLTGTGATSPVTVSGLTNGTAYTFTVTATNATGTGPASAASNSVTPVANPTYSIVSTTVTSTPTTGKNLLSYGIVADSTLNYYVTSSYRDGSSVAGPQLIKYNKDGVIQWQKALLSGFGTGYTVTIDSSDNLYVAGNISLPSTYARMVLLKYNSSGTLLFQKTYNVTGTYNCQIRKIVVDSSGNIYCAVNSNANTGGSDDNGYVMKLDSTGAVTWIKGLGTFNTNLGTINMFGVGVDSSSNVYINGLYRPGNTSNQAVVAQLSSAGSFNWRVGTNVVSSPAKNFYTQGGVTDSSGNTVICGVTTNGSVAEGGFIKYDNTGAITWQIRFGDGTNYMSVNAVALDGSGNIYSTGYYITGGRAVMFVAKHNSSGSYQWHRTISASLDIQGTGIYASSTGTVYATGYIGDNASRFDGVVGIFDTNGNASSSGVYALNGWAIQLGTIGSFSSSSTTLTANTNNLGFFTPTVNVLTNIGTETTTASADQVAIFGTTPIINATQKAIFGYGDPNASPTSITNLVSNTGVVAANTTGVGSPRSLLAAAGYGGDKAIFGYGSATGSVNTAVTNLVSNTGVVATDTAGVGTARPYLAATGYGGDKAIFAFGAPSSTTTITNLVSNTGVVATDTNALGEGRYLCAGATYGTSGQAIFAYGLNSSFSITAISSLVSNTGVVATDTAGVGTARQGLAAASFAYDRAIFGYGSASGGMTAITNKVSNTGIIASDTTGVGSARSALAAAGYGADKAIFGYGTTTGSNVVGMTNLVSNTGVVSADTTAVGQIRKALAAAGYSLT